MASSVTILKQSITKLGTEIIVNAANPQLQHGAGVCGYIFEAAGPDELQEACNEIGGCPTGGAVITPGFNLCKYIVHAVGPRYIDGKHNEPKQLYSCYQKALDLAKENECHSIGFPLISSGIFGYPKDKAWRKALQSVYDWIDKNPDYEIEVQFAVVDNETLKLVEKTAEEVQNDIGNKVGIFFSKIKKASGKALDQAKAKVGEGLDSAKEAGGQALETLKEKGDQVTNQIVQAKKDLDKKIINPVFLEDLYNEEFAVPTVIRLFEESKKMSNEVCKGALGYIDNIAGLKILNIQLNYVNQLFNSDLLGGQFQFYPNLSESLYYCDPFAKRYFISLDDYFDYLKQARIDELEKIAYDLGAKHFKINYVEEKKTFAGVKGKVKESAGAKVEKNIVKASDEFDAGVRYNSGYSYKLAKESDFEGSNTPVMPKLLYFKNNTDINNLIEMRLNGTHAVKSKRYMLKYETSIGINASIAKKMDAAVASYKYEANATVSSEVENQKRLSLEYIIEF